MVQPNLSEMFNKPREKKPYETPMFEQKPREKKPYETPMFEQKPSLKK